MAGFVHGGLFLGVSSYNSVVLDTQHLLEFIKIILRAFI